MSNGEVIKLAKIKDHIDTIWLLIKELISPLVIMMTMVALIITPFKIAQHNKTTKIVDNITSGKFLYNKIYFNDVEVDKDYVEKLRVDGVIAYVDDSNNAIIYTVKRQ